MAARAAGGVFRLRPIITAPSIRTIEIPGRSPRASASNAVVAPEPTGASHSTMSAARPATSAPVSRRWTRAVLPVAIATATSGATSASDARWAIVRRIPSGTTPVPDGASFPRITRASPPSSPAATRAAWIAARYLAPPALTLRAMLPPGMLERLELVAERRPADPASETVAGAAAALGGMGLLALPGVAGADPATPASFPKENTPERILTVAATAEAVGPAPAPRSVPPSSAARTRTAMSCCSPR